MKQNRLRNREKARLEGRTYSKAFRPRLAFHSADYSMTFPADKAENRPHFENLSARVRVWTADFGGRLVKLGGPGRDVGADGEIV